MIFCFSGTGNSLWVAKKLGNFLQEPVEGLVKYREIPLTCSDDIVGFVLPTYMGDIPWIVKEIILKARFRADSYVFLVMTSNNGESGISSQSMDKALTLGGSCLSAVFDLQMPGNCLISTQKENQERLLLAPNIVKDICEEVRKRAINYQTYGEKPEKGFVENSYFYGVHSLKRLTMMKCFKIMKACNGCGLCEEVCPVNNIIIKEGKAVHMDQCAACYACLHWCPQNASRLKVPVLNRRPQYHHPEISLKDIIKLKGNTDL